MTTLMPESKRVRNQRMISWAPPAPAIVDRGAYRLINHGRKISAYCVRLKRRFAAAATRNQMHRSRYDFCCRVSNAWWDEIRAAAAAAAAAGVIYPLVNPSVRAPASIKRQKATGWSQWPRKETRYNGRAEKTAFAVEMVAETKKRKKCTSEQHQY